MVANFYQPCQCFKSLYVLMNVKEKWNAQSSVGKRFIEAEKNVFKNLFINLLEMLPWNTVGQTQSFFAVSWSEQNCGNPILTREYDLLVPFRHHNCFARDLQHDFKTTSNNEFS